LLRRFEINHGSIHRALTRRLAGITLIICLIAGTIAWLSERSVIGDRAVDRAVFGTQLFNNVIQADLDRSDGQGIQDALESFASGIDPAEVGSFVYFSIVDGASREVARVVDDEHESLPQVLQFIEDEDLEFPETPGDIYREIVRLSGQPYLFVASPLAASDGSVVAYSVGMFAPSEKAFAELRRSVIETVLWVVLIVLATTALLYPVIIRLLGRLSAVATDLLEANLETIQVLGSAIAMRDSDTDVHNYRVTIYAVRLGQEAGLGDADIRTLIKGAFLHDVGKIGIRDHILLKPGKLTDDEFTVMKTHVDHGTHIVSSSRWLQDASDVVGNHHEKVGGGGYPRGLAGDEIPLTARIFAIADVFDALTSRRPYKEPFSYERTMEMLDAGRGSHFDSNMLDLWDRIALPLHEEFADRGDDHPRQVLRELTSRYFDSDFESLLAA
jgi:HD-GYP domain-containing protein (c-di-GMP phosphodiesterase class II)